MGTPAPPPILYELPFILPVLSIILVINMLLKDDILRKTKGNATISYIYIFIVKCICVREGVKKKLVKSGQADRLGRQGGGAIVYFREAISYQIG